MADTEHTPQQEPRRTQPAGDESHNALGPTIGIIIIVALLVAGAFYFWGTQFDLGLGIDGTGDAPQQQTETDPSTEALRDVSTSTDVDAIEQDLNATELEDLDQELQQIEQDLGI